MALAGTAFLVDSLSGKRNIAVVPLKIPDTVWSLQPPFHAVFSIVLGVLISVVFLWTYWNGIIVKQCRQQRASNVSWFSKFDSLKFKDTVLNCKQLVFSKYLHKLGVGLSFNLNYVLLEFSGVM